MDLKYLCAVTTAFLSLSVFANHSHAGEFDPKLNGVVLFEVQNDWAFDSDDPDAEVDTLSGTIEPYLILSFNDRLAVEASLILEPMLDTPPGEDTAFDNEGMYAEELKITYTGDHFGVFAGKYNPSFGTAWDLAPGIYGADFAEDYELTERIGFGASYTFGSDETGEHTIAANTFFLDTSALSQSVFTKRGRTDKNDGGMSNTESLASYSVTIDSENLAGVEGLNTHAGYRNQAPGDEDTGLDRESGYVAGVNYTFPVSENVEATALAEGAGIVSAEGSDDDIYYLTTGIAFTLYENWNISASYTNRNTNVEDGEDVSDHLYQVSAGYAFDNGISIDVGYRGSEEDGVDTHILGGLVGYVYEF